MTSQTNVYTIRHRAASAIVWRETGTGLAHLFPDEDRYNGDEFYISDEKNKREAVRTFLGGLRGPPMYALSILEKHLSEFVVEKPRSKVQNSYSRPGTKRKPVKPQQRRLF